MGTYQDRYLHKGVSSNNFFRNLNLDSDIPWHKTILIPKIRMEMRNLQKPVSACDLKILGNAWECIENACMGRSKNQDLKIMSNGGLRYAK